MNVIEIAQQLLRYQTITPAEDGALDFIASFLTKLGFKCEIKEFTGDDSYLVKNLYARLGNQKPNWCFAGHIDVVPCGEGWTFPPFAAHQHQGLLYGRGVVDMKGAIAAMMAASAELVIEGKLNGSISLLITCDEEGSAINGTNKMLKYLHGKGEKIDDCLVGEPTNPTQLGQMLKIGRRGSITFNLIVHGKQGHVAYPQNADNPISKLVNCLYSLKHHQLDTGTEFFDPSNLEIVKLQVDNTANNVIPAEASATFNIRFNDLHNKASLEALVKEICDAQIGIDYHLEVVSYCEAFISKNKFLEKVIQEAVFQITGIKPISSTSGGTSDARFIKNYANVIEFGLVNKTAHQVDECCSMEDIEQLQKIYYLAMKRYFNSSSSSFS